MTPLVLVTGFLGAGKTTFLKQTLPLLTGKGLVPHVILNDYQNAEVDASLLRGLAAAVEPIDGSCVCCGSADELMDTIDRLDTGEKSLLFIEANGTTDTDELIELLSFDERSERFSLPVQISLVDAKRWQRRFFNNSLEKMQVETATHLIVTHQDEVKEARLQKVLTHLQKINSRAKMTDFEEIAEEMKKIVSEMAPLPPRSHGRHAEDKANHTHDHHHHDHAEKGHDHQAHHFASFELPLKPLIPEQGLRNFLNALPESVIRAKGIAFFSENPKTPQMFQKIERFQDTQIFALDETPSVSPTALFIGPHLPEIEIRQLAVKEAILLEN